MRFWSAAEMVPKTSEVETVAHIEDSQNSKLHDKLKEYIKIGLKIEYIWNTQ